MQRETCELSFGSSSRNKKQKKNSSSETPECTHTSVNVLSLTQCTPVTSILHVDTKGTIETHVCRNMENICQNIELSEGY